MANKLKDELTKQNINSPPLVSDIDQLKAKFKLEDFKSWKQCPVMGRGINHFKLN